LADPLLGGRSAPVSSCTLVKLDILSLAAFLGDWYDPVGIGPRLDPLPLVAFGGGDATRVMGDSKLAVRRCDLAGTGGTKLAGRFFGMAGTGGASSSMLGLADPLFGD
jgi:hypothetical protein